MRISDWSSDVCSSDLHAITDAAATGPSGEWVNIMQSLEADAPPVTANFTARQGYLNAAPGGIDALYAATVPGGRGAGIGIIDIEGAWRFAHEDLHQNQGGVVGGTPTTDIGWRNHGTAVIGVLGGDRNRFGVTGIRSEEHTSELQSLMRISYAVFCLKQK